MFPAIRVKVAGLDPKSCYMLMMDVVPLDNKRYRSAGRHCAWHAAANHSHLHEEYNYSEIEINLCTCLLVYKLVLLKGFHGGESKLVLLKGFHGGESHQAI